MIKKESHKKRMSQIKAHICNRFLCVLFSVLGLTFLAHDALANEIGSQDNLPITINDGFKADNALKMNWPMLHIGTGQYEDGPTGMTVIKFNRPVRVAVDARGGGPGTINAPYLDLAYPFPTTDAVVFAGGSWYGLEAATAVTSALKEDGIRSGHWTNIGLAVGSIIYDFGSRRLNEIYPDKRLAQAAYRAAVPSAFPRGAYGAGRSAVFGAMFGCNAKSGQGAAYREIGDVKIAAFVVVNALGVVVDREGNIVACNRGDQWPKTEKMSELLALTPDAVQPNWNGKQSIVNKDVGRTNTTISLVVTNRKLDAAELKRLAIQVHMSMGRGIQPYGTELDGDVLYAATTDEVEKGPGDALPTFEIATVASELMWDAILSAVPEQPKQPVPSSDSLSDLSSLNQLEGTYEFSDSSTVSIRVKNGYLMAKSIGEKQVYAIEKEKWSRLIPEVSGGFMLQSRYPFKMRFNDDDTLTVNPGRWEQTGHRVYP